jgi:hypothetical protein
MQSSVPAQASFGVRDSGASTKSIPISKALAAHDRSASAMKAVNPIARSPQFQGLAVDRGTVGVGPPEVVKGLDNTKAMRKQAGIEADTSIPRGQPETALGKLGAEVQSHMLMRSRLRFPFGQACRSLPG